MFPEALRKVTSRLDDLQVPYALIGGLAIIARGVLRATRDVDLLIDWRIGKGPSLAQSLSAVGLAATFQKGGADDPLVGLIRLDIPVASGVIRCDLIFPGAAWQAEMVQNATRVEIEGLSLRVARASDLFLLKLRAGEPHDLLDAAELLQLQVRGERASWEAAATKRHLSRAYKRCLQFLKESG